MAPQGAGENHSESQLEQPNSLLRIITVSSPRNRMPRL
jgi:hypothetical protein